MTRFLRFFPQRRPSVLQRLFISLYQTIHFIRLYEQNNKNELLVARCSSGFLLFLKMSQVSSCGFETLLRHYFLFIYIYILSLFCVSFHCSYFFFFFVSVNIISVNILINKIKVFVWVWRIYEEKIDYWLLFIFKEPKVHLLSLVSQCFFLHWKRAWLTHCTQWIYSTKIVIVCCSLNSVVPNAVLLHV